MSLRDKNILWLVDYTVKEVPAGGAEITDDHVIRAGEELGYNINVIRPNSLRSNVLSKADIVVFSNCYEFPNPAKRKVMEEKPYIVYSHDSGRWSHVLKDNPDMMKNSLATIFLSPLHRDCFSKYLTEVNNTLLIPPHIPYTFFDKGEERVNKIMFVGNIHEGKGIYQIIDYAKDNPKLIFDFYYKRSSQKAFHQLKKLKNCNLVGYVPKEKIHENYNIYKYFIHIPVHQESFGRAVGEAYLSGCDLIVNDRVGALSYGWTYKEFREKTLNAHYLFWEKLEDCINI